MAKLVRRTACTTRAARRVGWWPVLFVVGIVLTSGCCRSSGPVRHEVRKPIAPASSSFDLPTEISYPDVPEVPDKIRGPSPPIEGPTNTNSGGGWFSWGHD
jgi:hypothetical protein